MACVVPGNERDAERAREGGWSKHTSPLPLFTSADAERAIDRFRIVPYDVATDLGGGVEVTCVRAGHVLGAASVLVAAGPASLLFSGDLGRSTHPVLRPRSSPPAARTVVMESTYGDRMHPPVPGEAHATMSDAIRRTFARGGSVLIPAFAVDRTELVLAALADLLRRGEIPASPVHVDSPMALAALDVYRRPSLSGELRGGVSPELADLPLLRSARTPEESMALNSPPVPSIIISASGMASGGRVVTHGEPDASARLADRIREELGVMAVVPRLGERVRVD